MSERVVVFIDGSNFYHSLKDSFGIHDNANFRGEVFNNLIHKIIGNRTLIGVYYYNAPLDRNYNKDTYSKQQRFFEELKRLPGWRITLCRLRKDSEGKYTIKGDDIQIAVDMVRLAYENAFDIAILISGDGDFVPAIQTIQKLGKKVENAYFTISTSYYLRQVCDNSILLDKIIPELLRNRTK